MGMGRRAVRDVTCARAHTHPDLFMHPSVGASMTIRQAYVLRICDVITRGEPDWGAVAGRWILKSAWLDKDNPSDQVLRRISARVFT